MTETQIDYSAVIITTAGDTIPVLSFDATEAGGFYVALDGYTNLMPWHGIARVVFYDQPPVAVDDPALPKGHEGSE